MPTSKELKANMQYVRAQIQKNTFKKETRSFDVVFVTENPCPAWHPDIGNFNEILSCEEKYVRMQRANIGLPVFDMHWPRNVMVQLGKARNIKFINREGLATITLGARADDALITDLENEMIDGISVGYNVYKYLPENIIPGQTPTYRAIDWEPGEISFAPVQADFNSRIRSNNADSHILIIDNYSLNKNAEMNKLKCACGHEFESDATRAACPKCGAFAETRTAATDLDKIRKEATDTQKVRLDTILTSTREAKLSDAEAIEFFKSEKSIEEIRQAITLKSVPVPNLEQIRKEANEAQKVRLDSILKSTHAAKLSDTDALEFFKSEKSIEEIRQAVIDKFVTGDPNINGNHSAGMGKEAIDKKREAATEAMLHRIAPSVFKIDEKKGINEFRSMSLIEIVKEFAQERGQSIRGLDRMKIADMVFAGTREQSTSDFPLLLEQLADKLLRQDYAFAPEYWQLIAKETSARDFKPKNLYQVESKNGMKEVPEGKEIEYTSLEEAKQTISVKSFAEGIMFTRKAFINDDLSAFSLIPNRFALDWNTLRGDRVWGLLIDNVTMDDKKALFHADHKNLITNDGALSDASLQAALLLFRRQKAIDGVRRLRVIPKFLVCAPDLEIPARKLLSSVFATKTGDVNVWNNSYQLIVEPRLTGNDWYLGADPAQIDSLYYCYLDGNSGLRSNREDNFNTDSIKFAVRGEFDANAIDYRGWVKVKGDNSKG
jgi:hypothetical protein